MIGDGAAFWLGHRFKRHILELWPLSSYPTLVAQSEEFFRRHGTLAVLFARFVAPIRAFVPITAGALGMSPPRFFMREHSGDRALGGRARALERARRIGAWQNGATKDRSAIAAGVAACLGRVAR